MGYRQLLKHYVSYMQTIVGSDFIALAELTQSFSKRDMGELRSIAAELKREAAKAQLPDAAQMAAELTKDHANVVRQLVEEGEISLEALAKQERFELIPDDENVPCSDEQLRTKLRAMATRFRA